MMHQIVLDLEIGEPSFNRRDIDYICLTANVRFELVREKTFWVHTGRVLVSVASPKMYGYQYDSRKSRKSRLTSNRLRTGLKAKRDFRLKVQDIIYKFCQEKSRFFS